MINFTTFGITKVRTGNITLGGTSPNIGSTATAYFAAQRRQYDPEQDQRRGGPHRQSDRRRHHGLTGCNTVTLGSSGQFDPANCTVIVTTSGNLNLNGNNASVLGLEMIDGPQISGS